jgi:hypothetical protein
LRPAISPALVIGLLLASAPPAVAGGSAEIAITATVQGECTLVPTDVAQLTMDFSALTPGATSVADKYAYLSANCQSASAHITLASLKGAAMIAASGPKTTTAGNNNYFDYFATAYYSVGQNPSQASFAAIDTANPGNPSGIGGSFTPVSSGGILAVGVTPALVGTLSAGTYSDTLTVSLLPN